MADKKKSGHSYLNDFQRNVAGDYIYAGDMYECGASREEIKQQKLFLGILTFLLSAAVIAGGCINAPGLHNVFYLIIPLVCEVGATGSVTSAVLRFLSCEPPLREYIYRRSVEALPRRALFETVFAGIGLLCETVYCIINKIFVLMAAVYLILKTISIVLCFLIRKNAVKYPWTKTENHNLI